MLVGTCNNALEPEAVRGVGVRVWPGACQLTLIVPAVTSAIAIANLRENGRLALTLSHIPTYKTMQVKGKVLAIREGDEGDRGVSNRYLRAFADDLAWAGQPEANTLRLANWPCYAIDLDIAVVYEQTPGPVAGVKMPLPAGRP